MKVHEKVLPTLEALQAEAARFLSSLSPRPGSATLVTLSGELGAGKTSFTQGAARALGVTESVTSPTFVLEKVYELPEKGAGLSASRQGFKRLVHLDAYRLENSDELVPLGFNELMQDPSSLVMLEWPERVKDALPAPAYRITFTVLPDNTRSISYRDA